MIIEMRTYTLRPGTLAEVEKRFGDALPNREKHSKQLAAFWHTEVGPLNQIIHVWAYDSFEQRAAVRAAATKDGRLAAADPRIRHRRSRARCSTRRRSRRRWSRAQIGPLFEIRQYTLAPGSIPGLIERWSEKIEGRQKFSPLVAGMYSEFGALNKWVHIWAYKDAERAQLASAPRPRPPATGRRAIRPAWW